MKLTQDPVPGKHCLAHIGDVMEFRLEGDRPLKGKAYVRTNIGNAALKRGEIIAHVESGGAMSGQDWHNIPMTRLDDSSFSLRVALIEAGHFEAKCCLFLEEGDEPAWPDGENIHVNVESSGYCCANSVYCAFVRQFGTNKSKTASSLPDGVSPAALKALDDSMYSAIPPSGTFRDLVKELDHIFGALKCRVLHLLPINPTPTVYGRMGRYGSPYASLDFTGVDPALAEFDRKATPLDQFQELVDAVHNRNAKIFIDIAINHTGWAAKLHETHPEWFVRDADGSIHSPGAWGVVWGDLTELDHRRLDLWKYLAEVFLTWCSRGVDGFRCDAGYMIPVPAWEYIIARVRSEYPDTVFLLEGLGGDPVVTTRLLDVANMNWAYSELFQNYTREEIEKYLSSAWRTSSGDGLMIHYAETHDNPRLAAVSKKYAKMRTALCALLSSNGAFGFANGVEWFAEERIDVHEASALNWGAQLNQVGHIARLNSILATHPAFHNGAVMEMIDSGSKSAVVAVRSDIHYKKHLLVAVNLNCDRGVDIAWDASDAPFDQMELFDLLSERRMTVIRLPGRKRGLALSAGQAVCLSPDSSDIAKTLEAEAKSELLPELIERQEAKAMTLSVVCRRNGSHALGDEDVEALASLLLESPVKFLEELCGSDAETPFVQWNWPEDLRRQAMLPPDNCLLLVSPMRFRAALSVEGRIVAQLDSLKDSSGRFFALFPPLDAPESHKEAKLLLSVYGSGKLERNEAPVLLLAPDVKEAAVSFSGRALRASPRTFVQGNGRGAILRPCLDLNSLRSRYDAVLLANLHPGHPEDRHIMWRRVRLWAVHHARSQEFSLDAVESFSLAKDGGGIWKYRLPIGNGIFIEMSLKLEILPGKNAVLLTLLRHGGSNGKRLCDETPVKIVIRPDIEDRGFHFDTKASQGPEKLWPKAISTSEKGFDFKPASDRTLSLHASKGRYRPSPEWYYMIWQPNEAARGLESNCDLFSPGYFEVSLAGDESMVLVGQILTPSESQRIPPHGAPCEMAFALASPDIGKAMLDSLRQFVVKRDKLKTVIAGYPWFLDWGRDTLICARGLIAAPEFREDVKDILLQFALFAEGGTLPNMICGGNASNRDTSDAQLWLFVACKDLCAAEGSLDFLRSDVRKGQKLVDVLESIVQGLLDGTPNGIKADKASGLLFSPAHFTWMDTNYPAATPREGYPVEIQALWFAALKFLSAATGSAKWGRLAGTVKASMENFFVRPGQDWLSDCLHCSPGTPPAKAVADDHLRPNQLFAITLGAMTDRKLCKGVLRACSSLLIPGAIRSLADRKVKYLLPIPGQDGSPLNTPSNPYWGRYEGDEDTRRKPAYHNGTAWTWPFPSYCEAYYMVYGEPGRATAKSILSSAKMLLDEGCATQMPEILDGDWPHAQRGCDAQAWGVSELCRVWKLLSK